MTTYTAPLAGEWVKPVMKGYRMACCDCGLVHVIDFKVIKNGRGHKVVFRASRHARATAAMRRERRIKVKFT